MLQDAQTMKILLPKSLPLSALRNRFLRRESLVHIRNATVNLVILTTYFLYWLTSFNVTYGRLVS
ncbi:hypothetical protein BDV30DRAFT_215278 [Aspergillus minisclerotigenes]|uniref:Uncharacterized protein n=1 Tax=Aspergillus minisclerotigenes TaxID=656917 RepID=A0A5N6IUM1_9EURO|nr:hypothetical protein BDV30DRAFT_215278 [Aspergillus minisclerotigenes]